MGVDQDFHDSNVANNSGGSGASKSSGICTNPLSSPGTRSFFSLPQGTSRAIGYPDLEMTTSSPADTRANRRDSWVLASCTLTLITVHILL